MKKLIFIAFLILTCNCEEKPDYWGCKKKTTLTYSTGRDTSWVELYIVGSATEKEMKDVEEGITTTTTEDVGNGVTRIRTVHIQCTPQYSPNK